MQLPTLQGSQRHLAGVCLEEGYSCGCRPCRVAIAKPSPNVHGRHWDFLHAAVSVLCFPWCEIDLQARTPLHALAGTLCNA